MKEFNFEPLKPPSPGFDIFQGSLPAEMNACLNFLGDMSYGYVEGYREAFNVLVDYISKTASDQETLIYPLLFMVRQHLELRLKNILKLLKELGERSDPPPFTHDLDKLWQECSPSLAKFSPHEDQQWFGRIGELMNQITSVDRGADVFRFPEKKDGTKGMSGIYHINIEVLSKVVSPLMDWLEGAECFLSEGLENLSSI